MTRSAPTHRCSWLRTTLRVIAVFVGISACALPRLVHGQSGQPLHATTSGSVSGECRPVQNYAWGGFGTQLTGGHVAGEGVGRKESISYIGLQPYMLFGQTLAFGDARLTRGNEGELAWSFGGGLRHYISQWDAIVGGNSYLDRDQLSGANFEQWSAGAEILTRHVDWRGSIYRPFGSVFKQVGLVVVPDSTRFSGNNVLIDQARLFARALEGFDTEIGVQLPGRHLRRRQVKGFVGAYWYEGVTSRDVRGWKLRLQGDLLSWLKGYLQMTDDQTFDTNVMFQVEVAVGGMKRRPECPESTFDRITQTVLRNRNIVVTDRPIIERDVPIIDPATGLPLFLYHVDSNNPLGGPGVGTVDNPFLNIQQAQTALPNSNLIFTHAGSTFNDPLSTIVLSPDERILGEGVLPELADQRIMHRVNVGNAILAGPGGTASVILPTSPAFELRGERDRPQLIGSNAAASVTMANNSEFSGYHIVSPDNTAIMGTGLTGDVGLSFNLIDNIPAGSAVTQSGSAIAIIDGSPSVVALDTVINHTGSPAAAVSIIATGPGFAPSVQYSSSQFLTASAQINTTGAVGAPAGPSLHVRSTVGGNIDLRLSRIMETLGGGIELEGANGGVTVGDAVLDGPDSGVIIDGGAGPIAFVRNFLPEMTITGASVNPSIAITGAGAFGRKTGLVTFDQITINDRGNTGISLRSLGDTTVAPAVPVNVVFNERVAINTVTPIVGAPPLPAIIGNGGVEFVESLGTIRFADDLSIISSIAGSGRGITVAGNVAGSEFDVRPFTLRGSSPTLISGPTAEGIFIGDLPALAIRGDGTNVGFESVTINDRAMDVASTISENDPFNPGVPGFAAGITVNDKDAGRVDFNRQALVDNQLASNGSAIDIRQNDAPIVFNDAVVANGAGFLVNPAVPIEAGQQQYGAGVNIFENPGLVRFDAIDIETSGGIGLYAGSNDLLIQGGVITADGAPAIEINSGVVAPARGDPGRSLIDITLNEVNSSGSPRNGIELLNVDGAFRIDPGSGVVQPGGGILTGAALSGTLNRNGLDRFGAGIYLDDVDFTTTIQAVEFSQNGFGIQALDSNRLDVERSLFDTNSNNGIVTRNVTDVRVIDSIFISNGTGTVALFDLDTFQNDILFQIDRPPLDDTSTDPIDDPDLEYSLLVDNSQFASDSTNVVAHTVNASPLLSDVQILDFEVEDSVFTNAGVGEFTTAATFDSADGVSVVWDGRASALIERNTFNLNGISQTAVFFNGESRDVATDLMVFNNAITNLGTTMGDFGDQFGIDVVNAGPTPTSIRIDNNQITFNNGRNTGMRFDLAADSNVSITNNEFLELFDQGTGILFTSVRAPASFFIENNLIGLTDNDVLIPGVGGGVDGIEERGIIFSSVSGGVVDLGGTENSVLLLNIGGDTDQFFFFPDPGLANGQIEINGIFVP